MNLIYEIIRSFYIGKIMHRTRPNIYPIQDFKSFWRGLYDFCLYLHAIRIKNKTIIKLILYYRSFSDRNGYFVARDANKIYILAIRGKAFQAKFKQQRGPYWPLIAGWYVNSIDINILGKRSQKKLFTDVSDEIDYKNQKPTLFLDEKISKNEGNMLGFFLFEHLNFSIKNVN